MIVHFRSVLNIWNSLSNKERNSQSLSSYEFYFDFWFLKDNFGYCCRISIYTYDYIFYLITTSVSLFFFPFLIISCKLTLKLTLTVSTAFVLRRQLTVRPLFRPQNLVARFQLRIPYFKNLQLQVRLRTFITGNNKQNRSLLIDLDTFTVIQEPGKVKLNFYC